MTVNEAATLLGIKPDSVRQQCRSGKLRATKRGRDWWITLAAVKQYQKENQR